MKNGEERLKIFAKSTTETLRKRRSLDFLHGTNFFSLISSDSRITKRAEHFFHSLLPLFIGKWGRSLPPSSPKRARLLPPEATAFWRNFLVGPSGLVAICTPNFTKYTPCFFFWWFFFRNVTKLYKFRNDACFLSVMLRNLMDYIIILFFCLSKRYRTLRIAHEHFLLTFGMSRNFTDCATMLSFDFRHVTELHGLPNDGCQVPRSGQMRVASQQRMVPGRN